LRHNGSEPSTTERSSTSAGGRSTSSRRRATRSTTWRSTPPPDYDLELAISSIHAIRDRGRGAKVLFSHFGPVEEVERICELAERRFRSWTEAVGRELERTDDLEEIVRVLERVAREDMETGSEAKLDLQRMETLSSVRMNAMGIMRYWELRKERERDQAS
jgi:hypothetical protein